MPVSSSKAGENGVVNKTSGIQCDTSVQHDKGTVTLFAAIEEVLGFTKDWHNPEILEQPHIAGFDIECAAPVDFTAEAEKEIAVGVVIEAATLLRDPVSYPRIVGADK